MSVKTKALVLNFICFALLYVFFQFGIGALGFQLPWIALIVISAVLASFIAPKFGVITKEGKEVLIMKTLFRKDIKEF